MTMSNLPHDRVSGPGRIHVFCEGETEVLYLQDFCRLIGLSGKKGGHLRLSREESRTGDRVDMPASARRFEGVRRLSRVLAGL
mgnify:FL=1